MAEWWSTLVHLATLGGPFLWLIALVGLVGWTVIVECVLSALMEREQARERISARLWLLRILAVIAPLIGLLGTVSGIIACFADLGAAAGRHLANGIAEALLCTAAGLVVAVPMAVAHAVLSRTQAAAAPRITAPAPPGTELPRPGSAP